MATNFADRIFEKLSLFFLKHSERLRKGLSSLEPANKALLAVKFLVPKGCKKMSVSSAII